MLRMEITKGKADSYKLTIRDGSGALVNLDGKELQFSAKEDFADADPPTIVKTSGSGITHDASQATTGKGLATLRLVPGDTSGLTVAAGNALRLVAELTMEQVDAEPEVIDTGTLTVLPAVDQ